MIAGGANSIFIVGIGDFSFAYSLSIYCFSGIIYSHRRRNLANKSRSCSHLARRLWNVYPPPPFIRQSDLSRYLYFQLKSHSYLYDEVLAEDAELEHATIPPRWAFGLSLPPRLKTLTIRLLVATVLVAICAEFLVSSIDGLVAGSNISEAFVGLILLPIVGNAAEVPRFSTKITEQ